MKFIDYINSEKFIEGLRYISYNNKSKKIIFEKESKTLKANSINKITIKGIVELKSVFQNKLFLEDRNLHKKSLGRVVNINLTNNLTDLPSEIRDYLVVNVGNFEREDNKTCKINNSFLNINSNLIQNVKIDYCNENECQWRFKHKDGKSSTANIYLDENRLIKFYLDPIFFSNLFLEIEIYCD